MTTLQKLHTWAIALLGSIPEIIQGFDGLDVEEKSGRRDLVTQVDQAVEAHIIKQIRTHFPDHATLGEETYQPKQYSAEKLWVIDPIDGTSNFIGQSADYATLLAYFENGKPMLSYIYLPVEGVLYSAIRGQGVYKNGVSITKPDNKGLAESIISFDLHRIYDYRPELFDKLMHDAFQVRREGCSGVDGARVLDGRFSCFLSHRGGPWDFAPHFLFAEELDLVLCNFEGHPLSLEDYSEFYFGTKQSFYDIFNIVIA